MKRLYHKIDVSLTGILILSLLLNLWGIWNIRTPNSYYLAAVVSMSQNLHNFFFASFDPAGFVSIDKPPVAFWIQTGFAHLFGLHGWSVILPQALAGTGSVLVLYLLLRPAFGIASARIASLILAVTPVSVAVSRTNNVDALLVFVLLTSVWFLFHATNGERNSKWYLCLAFALIGVAFNIKMLEAYLILPSFIVYYLAASREKWLRRISILVICMAILTVVSLSWATAVDSVPGNTRPFIGSSAANSVTDLAFGYNGAQRLTGKAADVSPNSGVSDLPNQVSSAGPARLFRVGFGTQISWFLPLALFCIPFVIVRRYRMDKKSRFKSRTGAEILFWIFYFIPAFCIFSYAGFFHRYYFVVMAPPIAALCGIGWTAMNNRFRQLPGLRPVIYPVSLLATVLLQTVYMAYYHLVQGIAFGLTGMMLLAILFLKNRELRLPHRTAIGPSPAAIIILLSALPLYWSMTPALYGGNNVLPEAGPQLEKPNSSIPGASGATNRSLIHYVLSQPPHTFLFGTVNAPAAAPYIIKTGKPVMAIGGFNGTDPIMKPEQLEQLIRQGKIRYFYFPPDAHVTETPIIQWIRTHGREITQKKWAGTQTGYNGQLYDLRSFELAKH